MPAQGCGLAATLGCYNACHQPQRGCVRGREPLCRNRYHPFIFIWCFQRKAAIHFCGTRKSGKKCTPIGAKSRRNWIVFQSGRIQSVSPQTRHGMGRAVCVGMTQPRWGWGLGISPPRVAALPQPWAMGQNPVGIPVQAGQGCPIQVGADSRTAPTENVQYDRWQYKIYNILCPTRPGRPEQSLSRFRRRLPPPQVCNRVECSFWMRVPTRRPGPRVPEPDGNTMGGWAKWR